MNRNGQIAYFFIDRNYWKRNDNGLLIIEKKRNFNIISGLCIHLFYERKYSFQSN